MILQNTKMVDIIRTQVEAKGASQHVAGEALSANEPLWPLPPGVKVPGRPYASAHAPG